MKKLNEYQTPETDAITGRCAVTVRDGVNSQKLTVIAATYAEKCLDLERRLAMCRDALLEIAHCDDLVIRGENDHPEIIRRLRFAVNLSEETIESTEPK